MVLITWPNAGTVAEYLHSVFGPFEFVRSTWFKKFWIIFTPAFLSTGVSFGLLYVLTMRALRLDRKKVEEWFEKLRHRLDTGPFEIVEIAHPVMLGTLQSVYGRPVWRRLATSFLVSSFFTLGILGSVYWSYKHVTQSVRETKTQIEKETDPVLYQYATDPKLRPIFEAAKPPRFVVTGEGGEIAADFSDPDPPIYYQLRRQIDAYYDRFVKRLYLRPERIQLTLLFIFDGTAVDPGFDFVSSLFLFMFNVLLDFVTVTITFLSLERLGNEPFKFPFGKVMVAFSSAVVGTLVCAAISFLSYRVFFSGDVRLFVQMLILLPIAIYGPFIGRFLIKAAFINDPENPNEPRILLFVGGVMLCSIALVLLIKFSFYWRGLPMSFASWQELISFPFVLAATTFVPATIMLIAFAFVLVLKMTAEPARVIQWSYMTFIKEEVGGTQVAGILLLLGVVGGVIATIVFPTP